MLMPKYLCFFSISTEGQEVKVGEYNAIADVLDLINNSIRFQGMWLCEQRPRNLKLTKENLLIIPIFF